MFQLKRKAIIVTLSALGALSPALSGAQSTLYVDDDAPLNGTGQSWAAAYRYLQDALFFASTHPSVREVRVAGGTYKPDRDEAGRFVPGDRGASFVLLSDVALRGGFAGFGHADPNTWDPSAFPAVLHGDLAGNDAPNWVNHFENSLRIVVGDGLSSRSNLQGFTVRAGYNGPEYGAGLYLTNSRMVIADCVFEENLGYLGGAITLLDSSPVISKTRFTGNLAWSGRGGAIYMQDTTPQSVTINDCTFVRNRAQMASAVADGGAIFNMNSGLTITYSVFQDNESWSQQPSYSNGGAICNLGEGLKIIGCTFLRNRALVAGGLWTARVATLENCVFSGNTSLYGGGAVIFNGTLNVVNCTFSKNRADDGGGIANSYGTVHVRNSILWGNTSVNAPGPSKAQVHNYLGTADYRYSCVEGILTALPGEDPPDPQNFPGCTETNPLFVDADGPDNTAGTPDDDLRVSAGSPVIDAGENSTLPWLEIADAAQKPRFIDEPSSPNVGLGTPPLVDIGAFEFSSAAQSGVLRPSHLWEATGAVYSSVTFPSWYSDDMYVYGTYDEFNPNGDLYLAFYAGSAATGFGVSIESGVSRRDEIEVVQAWDVLAGEWVTVYTRLGTTGDSRMDAELPGVASRFRHPGTGRVLLRVQWIPINDTSVFDGWGVRIDQAVLYARP